MPERFQQILDSAPDAIVVVDRRGRIDLVNLQTEEMFGYAREQLLGQPVEMLLPKRFRDKHPQYRDSYFANPRVRPMGAEIELYALSAAGTEIPVEISLSPLEMPEGLFVMSAIRDITDQRRAEDRFRGLLESAPDAMVIVDRSGRIQLVNSQTELLFGYSREELLQQPVEILLPQRYRDSHPTLRNVYFLKPQPRPMAAGLDLSAQRKDGTEIPVEISLSPLETEEGVLVTAAIRDVRDRKQIEREFRQLNSDLERRVSQRTAELAESNRQLLERNEENEMFIYSASHDLRSPLVNLQGFGHELWRTNEELRVLLQSSELPRDTKQKVAGLEADMQEAIEFIRSAVMRMSGLIDALLRLSRAGRVEYQWTSVDVDDIVQRVLRAQASRITALNCEVSQHQLPRIRGDATAIGQIFDNLLSNALKYLDPERRGRIEIGHCDPGPDHESITESSHVFYVRDNGLGISKKHHDQIFKGFQRFHPNVEEGEGLGLLLVKRLVSRHGGSVWFESIAGQGSTFFVALPESESPARTGSPSGD